MSGKLFRNFSFLSATLSFFILIGIFAVLFTYAQDAMHEFGFDFLWNDIWEADEDDEGGVFGGFIPIVGTLLSTLIAMLIATPLAMGILHFPLQRSLLRPLPNQFLLPLNCWQPFQVSFTVCGDFFTSHRLCMTYLAGMA